MHSYDAGLNVKNGFPVFSTCLEANYIKKREDVYSLYSLTDEDKVSILELARDPRIGEPSINGGGLMMMVKSEKVMLNISNEG